MSEFNSLDGKILRERINATQLWDSWIDAEDQRRHSFCGSMVWRQRSGRDYLYRKIGQIEKSLGPRADATVASHTAFHQGRDENAARLADLAAELNTQAAILRGLGAGRVPVTAARILREIRMHGRDTPLRVVGTNALYAYEGAAGVQFRARATATGDIDLLQDDRRRLRLVTDDKEPIGLAHLIRARVDRSFAPRAHNDFRLTNSRGYMVELIRPQPRPIYRRTAADTPAAEGDLTAAPIPGLQWLVNAPALSATVIDENGFPAPMTAPDPRIWAAHKAWLAQREDRDPAKVDRDRLQAAAVIDLLRDRLPHLPLNDAFMAALPAELARPFGTLLGAGAPDRSATPDW